MLQGNLYVDSVVTPILDYWKGPAANHNFTMFTGQESVSTVGQIYSMDNDSPYIWLTNKMYTSTGFVNAKWYNEANLIPQFFSVP